MSRPIGSKNRPKHYISVTMKELTAIFKEEALIDISIKYAAIFRPNIKQCDDGVYQRKEKEQKREEKIDFTIHRAGDL